MRRAILLTFVASAVLGTAHGQTFLNRPMADWLNDLNDPNVDVRRGAAFALGKIGAQGDAAKVVDALTRRLSDPREDAVVKDFAASGLGDVMTALGPQSVAYWANTGPALQQALKDKAPAVRRSAACGLGAFGEAAAPARDDLIAALGDSAAIVRQNAAWRSASSARRRARTASPNCAACSRTTTRSSAATPCTPWERSATRPPIPPCRP